MLNYQAPVLSLALSPDNATLIASTTDRALTIRRRDLRHAAAQEQREAAPNSRGVAAGVTGGGVGAGVGGGPRTVRTGTSQYFNRGKNEGPGEGVVKVRGTRGGSRRATQRISELFSFAPSGSFTISRSSARSYEPCALLFRRNVASFGDRQPNPIFFHMNRLVSRQENMHRADCKYSAA